jgi:hypothetical protein
MRSIGPEIPSEVEGISINDMSRGATIMYQEDLDMIRDKARRLDGMVAELIARLREAGFKPVIMSRIRQYELYPGPRHGRQLMYHMNVRVEDDDGQIHSFAMLSACSCHPSEDGTKIESDCDAMNGSGMLEYAKLGANGYPIEDSIEAGLTPIECVGILTAGKAAE